MKNTSQGSQTVARAMDLLRHVSARSGQGLRLQQISEITQLSRPTTHRLLKELVDCGMLMRSPDRRYFLGQFAYELGLSAASHFQLREVCAPFLENVALATGDTAFLVTRSGPDSFCLDRRTGSFPVKVFTLEVGNRQPLGVGAAGLALLSWLPEVERTAVLTNNETRLAQFGGLTTAKLSQAISAARENGHAQISDFAIPGVAGIGVPVLDPVGVPIVAMSVAAVTMRMTAQHQANVLSTLQQEASKLKATLYKHRSSAPHLST